MAMFRRILFGVFFCVSFLWADEIPSELQKAVDKFVGMSAFQAKIRQTNFIKMTDSEEIYSGEIFFDRDKLLIKYASPSVQLVFSDKHETVVFLQESNQKIVSSPTLIFWPNKMVAKFLDGGKDFLRKKEGFGVVYEFVPNLAESDNVAKVEIGLKEGEIFLVKYFDFEGNSTCYEFFDLQPSKKIEPSLFEFSLPDDVEVIENR